MRRLALATVCAFWMSTLVVVAQAQQDPIAAVRSALAELQQWLATGSTQAAWNEYLLNGELQTQLAAETPDAAIVSRIITAYRSGAPGLELPRFVAVRRALERWVTSQPFYDQQLPRLIRGAQLQPPSDEQLNRQREDALDRLSRLRQFLSRARNGQSWEKYLDLNALVAALQQQTPETPQVLETSRQRFESGHRGLEMRPFRRAAAALDRYVRTLHARNDQQLAEQFQAQIETMASALEKEAPDQIVDLKPLTRAVDFLYRHNQASDAIHAVENRFPFKNAFFTVSELVLDAGFQERLDETQMVSEVQQGTFVTGTAHTVGVVSAELIPSPNEAIWDAVVRGRTITNTLGRNRSACVSLVGNTDLLGRMRLIADPDGVEALRPTATAQTDLTTTGIGSTAGGIRGCIVTRIASRRVAQTLPQAEETTSRRAESQLLQRLRDRARKQLANANRLYWENFRRPLSEKERFPADLKLMTTSDYVFASATFSGPARIGSPTLPPTWNGPLDLGLVIHETAVNSLAQGMLAGETLNSEDVKEEWQKNIGKLPARFEEDEDREPWSITFADQDPVEVQFRDDGMKIMIRGQSYTSGDRRYRAMNVTAAYKFQATPEGIKGIRQGDLEIFPPGFVPGQRRLSVAEQTLRRMLERRMGKILTPEIGGDDVILPGRFEKAGPMQTRQMAGAAGWLVMAWGRKASSPSVQTAMKKLP